MQVAQNRLRRPNLRQICWQIVILGVGRKKVNISKNDFRSPNGSPDIFVVAVLKEFVTANSLFVLDPPEGGQPAPPPRPKPNDVPGPFDDNLAAIIPSFKI